MKLYNFLYVINDEVYESLFFNDIPLNNSFCYFGTTPSTLPDFCYFFGRKNSINQSDVEYIDEIIEISISKEFIIEKLKTIENENE